MPPGRSTRSAASKVCCVPSASIATSTPRPSVSRMIASTGSSFEKSTTWSAPSRRAIASRSGTPVDGDDRRRAHQLRAGGGAEADRSLGEDRDAVADADAAALGAAEAGRHDVRAHQHLLVGQLRPAPAPGWPWRPAPARTPPGSRRSCCRSASRRSASSHARCRRRPARRSRRGRRCCGRDGVMAPAMTRWPSR